MRSKLMSAAGVIGIAVCAASPVSAAKTSAYGLQLLYAFGTGTGPQSPASGLVSDGAGNLYGTTFLGGGTGCAGSGCGTVFRLAPDGTLTILHAFAGGSDGYGPNGSLVFDSSGNLYGTTYGDLAGDSGTAFEIAADGTYSVLHVFNGGTDGSQPDAGLILDQSGNLYGTTAFGGGTSCASGLGCGTVFELSSGGTESVRYRFQGGKKDGSMPEGALAMDTSGNLFGATYMGGKKDQGTVFELAVGGTETILHSFRNGGKDGAFPAGVIIDAAGNLYGTTFGGGGGKQNCGTVYRLAPDGTITILYAFKAGKHGGDPGAALVFDTSGNLYGTTGAYGGNNAGTVFEISASGGFSVLYNYDPPVSGGNSNSTLILDSVGDLFGTTGFGGPNGGGTVFELSPPRAKRAW